MLHQGEKDNCWSEQSPEKSTVSTVPFWGLLLFDLIADFTDGMANNNWRILKEKYQLMSSPYHIIGPNVISYFIIVFLLK